MIEVSHLTKVIQNGANRVEILRDVSFTVPAGQFLAIMGASGSGKTTLLGLLAGLDDATSGTVLLDGTNITKLSEDRLALIRGMKIGFVFQSYQLVPTLTARENVLLPAELAGFAGDIEKRADELLDRVGLSSRGHHYPIQLSGGEQQRVALARAIAPRPGVLFADEPTGNLDTHTGEEISELLFALHARAKTTLFLVTHEERLAQQCSRIIRLKDGLIVADGAGLPHGSTGSP
jgi:putative ABC transport system ATP-binding protein